MEVARLLRNIMDNENQTLEADPGESDYSAVSAEGAQNDVVNQPTTPALTLDQLNRLTRRNYASIEEAEKGLDNLVRMTGAKEVVKEVVDPSLVETVNLLKKQVQEANFYAENPDLKTVKDFLSKFDNPAEAVKDPVIKQAVDALKNRADSETLKSTPRVDQPSADYQTDLQKAEQSGNWTEFLAKHKGLGFK